MADRPRDVFISYSSTERASADRVCEALEAGEIACWMAPRDIAPGTEWMSAIVEAIHDCRCLLLLVSAAANSSPQVAREVERAVSRRVPVLPVRIEPVALSGTLEYLISIPHWFDALTPPLENHLPSLVEAVRRLLQRAPEPAASSAAARPELTERPPAPAPAVPASQAEAAAVTVTFLIADIEESARWWEKNPAAMRSAVARYETLVRGAVEAHGGSVFKTVGDSLWAAFATAPEALEAAVAAQCALTAEGWGRELTDAAGAPPGVRAALHTGAAERREGDYAGPALSRATRIAAVGRGGQILLSDATRAMMQAAVGAGMQLVDLGAQRLPGLEQPEHLYGVQHPNLPPLTVLPASAPDAHRTHLPASSTSFVGREPELADLQARLLGPDTRLMSLVGFGGVGKTRMALQLAELCAHEFADGAWWAALEEARSAEEMVQRIAYHLGLQLQPQPSVKEQLWRFLRERQMLLVLDNTEQIADAGPVVHEMLMAAPRLKCLVTTRRALELQAEQVVDLEPLPGTDARRLFIERARARKADFALTEENTADVDAVCRRLEGMPLAIELAASRIAGMTPREIQTRLAERFRLLQIRAPELPPRQRALRGAMDWSYELLTEEDQSLFAQLAAFAGGFTLEHVEAICDAYDVFEGVMELRRHSLLRAATHAATQQTRYRMLESVQEYAAERLQAFADGGTAVRLRHAEQFRDFAQEQMRQIGTPGEVQALQQLEADFDNVRAAMDWAQHAGRHELCAQMALALGGYQQRRGFQREGLRRIEVGLEAACQAHVEETQLYSELLRECASLLLDHFEWAEARRRAGDALALFEQLGDERGQADAHNLLGLAAHGERNYTEARRLSRLALEQFERAGDRCGVAKAHNNLGRVEFEDEQGDKAEADREWQEALRLFRESGDQRGVAAASNNLGTLAQEQGNLAEARRYYTEALQFERELRDAFGVARALSNLGEVAELEGEAGPGFRLFTAAEMLFDEIGSPYRDYTGELRRRLAARLDTEEEGVERLRASLRGRSLDDLASWALTDEGEAITLNPC